ncbi:MAG: hypothetical protein Q8M91_15330 [Polaromonas sp.]|nr:hypothetical protein [Polaromonas sp.]MDP3606783.1 hypothetical protein [Polaromonas sp.]
MKPHLLIGTPCYGGNLSVNYFHAIRRLLPLLEQQGIAVSFKTLAQESLISRARNTIVAEFLGRPECSHLLFIDADIGFEPELVPRLLAHGQLLVCAAYPMKAYNWDKVLEAAKTAGSSEALKRASLQFAANMRDEDWPQDTDRNRLDIVNGFVRVSKAATGMMLIERQVFERLKSACPQLQYNNDVAGYDNPHTRGNFWTFFDTLVHPVSRRYLSEDYAFCYRWTQACQGEIWLDIESRLSHHGNVAFAGSFLESAG